MLQDLPFGRLENEYRSPAPTEGAVGLYFKDGQVLLKRDADDTLHLPPVQNETHYVFRMEEKDYFLCEAPEAMEGFAYEPVRTLRQLVSKEVCFAIMTGWHLHNWYQANRFCGRCGNPTVHDTKERMLRCPDCGNMIFPKSPPPSSWL
jgi:NAD+ diphosphatase